MGTCINKRILTVLFVAFCVLLCGCGPSRQERIKQKMIEIEQLDVMRKKAAEIISEQEGRLAAERLVADKAAQLYKRDKERDERHISLEEDWLASLKQLERPAEKIRSQERFLHELREMWREKDSEYQAERSKFVARINKMAEDLWITKASYDSLNALHTQAVVELSQLTKKTNGKGE